MSGQFLWTGFDYIGEPTPYGYPAHSSYFGLIDLCGFPKDTYYMYQSEWNTDETVLHLFPHWNWHEGDTIDLWCYYNNADEVELLVNGKSQGVKSKTEHVFHTMWRTAFEPGEITAISRKDGRIVPTEAHLKTKEHWLSASISDYQGSIAELARKSIKNTPKENRDISTLTMALDSTQIQRIREILAETRKSIVKIVNAMPSQICDSVYQLNFQLFPMMKKRD